MKLLKPPWSLKPCLRRADNLSTSAPWMGEDAISEEDHLRGIGEVSIGDEERLMGVPRLEAELDVPRREEREEREEGEDMLDCCQFSLFISFR